MADISDVENAIKAALLAVVYPQGTSLPSVTDAEVSLQRGWPQEKALNATLAAGNSVISTAPKPGHDRPADLPIGINWQQSIAPVVTLTAINHGNIATYGGTVTAGQIATLTAYGIGFSYVTQSADTLASVAVALASAVVGDGRLAASATGPSVSVTTIGGTSVRVTAQTGATGTVWREVARRQSIVTITVWAPTPPARDTLGALVDSTIAGYDYLTAPDTTAIKVELDALRITDGSENATLYRRDRDILVQYSVTQTAPAAQMLIPLGTMTASRTEVIVGTGAPMSGILIDASGNVLEDAAGDLGGDRQEPYSGIATDSSGNVQTDSEGNLVGVQ